MIRKNSLTNFTLVDIKPITCVRKFCTEENISAVEKDRELNLNHMWFQQFDKHFFKVESEPYVVSAVR